MKYLFLGDSITDWFNTDELLAEFAIENRGVAGNATDETYELIDSIDFAKDYDKIFLCIGTNDLARGKSEEDITANIVNILTKLQGLSPNSEIYVQSIFPTRENVVRPNERIMIVNKLLNQNSEKIGYQFLDFYEHFIDETNRLKELYTEDGLHLTRAAYFKWADLLKEYL